MSILWTILVGIPVIGILIFVHELGHFLVAKRCGVGVVKFAIGFGPALFRFTREGTIYQIGLIPLGGFVRMVGDMPDMLTGEQASDQAVRDESISEMLGAELTPEVERMLADRNCWFIEKTVLQRSAIVFAGPLFNFLFSFFLVAAAVFFLGRERLDQSATIGRVSEGSPAAQGGLLENDLVLSIDGQGIDSWVGLAQYIHSSSGAPLALSVKRNSENLDLLVQPQKKEIRDSFGQKQEAYLVGIGPRIYREAVGMLDSLYYGVVWTFDRTVLTYMGIWGIISGQVSPKDLAGPLFILDAAGQEAEKGFERLIYFMAFLSLSLGALNLLPIPILDGGHLMFFLVESIFGPISVKKKEFAQQIGMLFLLFLMVFAIHNDIARDPQSVRGEIEWDESKKAQKD